MTNTAQSEAEQVREAAAWSDYHSSTALSFEPGVFNLYRSGRAAIAVHEDEIEWETNDESGKTYVVINLPAGEAEAIRDWLSKWLPVPAAAIRSMPLPTSTDDDEPCHGPEDTWCPSCPLGGPQP